jgi:hypothetical protein
MGNLLIYSARRRFLHLAASAAIGEPCPGGDCIAVGHQGRSTGVSWSLPKCRNLRAFSRVQTREVRSLPPAEPAIASILAPGL